MKLRTRILIGIKGEANEKYVEPICQNNLSNRKQLLLPPLLKTCAWLTCDYISIGRNNVDVIILYDLQKLHFLHYLYHNIIETCIYCVFLANDVQIMKWISWHMQQTIREKQTTTVCIQWVVVGVTSCGSSNLGIN